MSTIKVNSIQNTNGVEVYTAKAWVNFNGMGTVGIRAAGNVSSITDNGVGDYTVNFASPMIDTNYCIVSGNSRGSGDALGTNPNPTFQTISTLGFRSLIRGTDNGIFDQDAIYFAIFR